MGSDTVSAAFRDAVEDKDVKAILFRVDSPGGSYVASDTVWRETVRTKKAGKPVVVSMGNVAGSGGYFLSMAEDKIVAQPATITASIGVLGGRILTTGFWDKIGLGWDEVHSSANARMWLTTSDYSPAEWARFEASLDRIYEDFTSKVADGRKLPKEKMLEIAKGRIWSGEDAQGLGAPQEPGRAAPGRPQGEQRALSRHRCDRPRVWRRRGRSSGRSTRSAHGTSQGRSSLRLSRCRSRTIGLDGEGDVCAPGARCGQAQAPGFRRRNGQ
jgi:signal peptide peptidase SppA